MLQNFGFYTFSVKPKREHLEGGGDLIFFFVRVDIIHRRKQTKDQESPAPSGDFLAFCRKHSSSNFLTCS
jgi:hypothetical protein